MAKLSANLNICQHIKRTMVGAPNGTKREVAKVIEFLDTCIHTPLVAIPSVSDQWKRALVETECSFGRDRKVL